MEIFYMLSFLLFLVVVVHLVYFIDKKTNEEMTSSLWWISGIGVGCVLSNWKIIINNALILIGIMI
jgi:hypothetical protein